MVVIFSEAKQCPQEVLYICILASHHYEKIRYNFVPCVALVESFLNHPEHSIIMSLQYPLAKYKD